MLLTPKLERLIQHINSENFEFRYTKSLTFFVYTAAFLFENQFCEMHKRKSMTRFLKK